MRQAAAVGMFDGVHLGHQALVRQLRALADERGLQPVAYTFDRHPLEVVCPDKAPRLLTSPDERCRLLELCGVQARVLVFDAALRMLTAEAFLRMLHDDYGVDMLLVGFNHRFGHDRIGGYEAYREIGDRIGLEVVLCDQVVEVDGRVVSSSAIRRALADGDLATATAMLGRCYSLTGTVAHGRGIGHTIGFPTANVVADFAPQLIPAEGVYAARCELRITNYELRDTEREVPAMVNIGRRPTIEGRSDAPLSIEAHLIGLDADLYGATLTLTFVAYLRSERHFPSLEALQTQLALDRALALTTLENFHPL